MAITATFSRIYQVDAECNVGIHRHEAKQEIALRALFRYAERQSCHFNDLTESPA
jgi:hypothetical protein